MRYSLVFGLLLSLASNSVLAVQIYKWVDENGQTHFSSQPPKQNNRAEELPIKTAPIVGTYTTPAPISPDTTSEIETNTKTKKEIQAEAKERAENCRIAKDNKEKLMSNFSRRFQQEDGSIRPFTDEERQKYLQQANESIAHFCN